MRKVRAAALAGAAAVAATCAAMAASQNNHVLNVAMPDGSVARIEYQGDIAPKVTLAPVAPLPIALNRFDGAPFAMLDQIAAQMDGQAEALMREAATLAAQPGRADGKLDMAAFARLPAGTVHYSFVATSSGSGTCSRSFEVTSLGADRAPKIVSTSPGQCARGDGKATPAIDQPSATQPARSIVHLTAGAEGSTPWPATI